MTSLVGPNLKSAKNLATSFPSNIYHSIVCIGALVGAVDFHKLCVVNINPERAYDGAEIGGMAVRGELDPVRQTLCHVMHEVLGGLRFWPWGPLGMVALNYFHQIPIVIHVQNTSRGRTVVSNATLG